MAHGAIKLECDSSVVLFTLIVLFSDGMFMLMPMRQASDITNDC